MAHNSAAERARTPLVPIPRTGVRGASGVFLFLMLALASAAVGIGLCAMRTASPTEALAAEIISGISCVLLIVHTWRIGRRAKGIMPILIVAAAMLAYLSYSLIPAAILLGLICGMTSGALLLSVITRKQAVWLPLIPLAAYAVTLLCSRGPLGSVACLLPLPAAWALSFGTRRSAAREDGPNRVGVICLTSFVLMATLAAMLALMLYRRLGSLDMNTLSAALEAARERVITWITSVEIPADTDEELRALFSRENAELVVNFTFNILPGYAIVAVNLVVMVAQLLLQAALVTFGCGDSLSDRVRVFRMSAVSCIVFVMAYVLFIITGGAGESLVGTVVHNIYIVLVPGLAFSGFLRLIAMISKRRMGCLMFGLMFLAPLLFLAIPLVPAMVEVVGRFVSFLSTRLHPPEDSDFPPRPPEDHDSDGTPPENDS